MSGATDTINPPSRFFYSFGSFFVKNPKIKKSIKIILIFPILPFKGNREGAPKLFLKHVLDDGSSCVPPVAHPQILSSDRPTTALFPLKGNIGNNNTQKPDFPGPSIFYSFFNTKWSNDLWNL